MDVLRAKIRPWLSTSGPWLLAVGLGALMGVWWWKMNTTTSNLTTVIGVTALTIAVFLGPQISAQPLGPRIGITSITAIALSLFAYYVLWSPAEKASAAPTSRKLNLEYRVLGVEKRTHEFGTGGEYKSLQIDLQIVNRSSRAMTLEFNVRAKVKRNGGIFLSVRPQAEWYDGIRPSLLPEIGERGARHVNIPREKTVEGQLFVKFAGKLPGDDLNQEGRLNWDDLSEDKIIIEVKDRISGKSIEGPFRAYPPMNAQPYIELVFPDELKMTRNDPVKGPMYGPIKATVVGVPELDELRREAAKLRDGDAK